MPVRRRFAFACLLLLVAAAAQAAGHQQFTLSDFTSSRLDRSYEMARGDLRVTLRPIGAHGNQEAVVARDRAALESIAYEIVGMKGVIAAVSSGRGVRFVTGKPAYDMSLSAPTLIDADGRPSTGLSWAIQRNSAEHATLHLEIDDPMVRYPVTVSFKASSLATSNSRPRFEVRALVNGSISGTVTDAVSGAPIVDEFVSVYDATGEFVTYGVTSSTGFYQTVDGLGTGTYYAFAGAANYLGELYNNIPCASGCDPTTGTAISVTDGTNTPGINFALTPTLGTVTGTVSASTGPLSDVNVLFYDNTDNPVTSAFSDASGFYSVQLSPDGAPYHARTFNNVYPGYIDQLYFDTDCVDCDVSTGTDIAVTAGVTTSGINFNLRTGGLLSGTVTDDATNPIINAFIEVFNSSGNLVTTAQTDAAGNYTSLNGLVSGTYYVRVTAAGYQPELYDDIPCSSCTVTSGTGVSVTSGSTTTGIDFELTAETISVSGTVTGTASAPLGGVLVAFYDNSGAQVEVVSTDASGNYSITLAAAGTYYAKANNTVHAGYTDQLYDGIDCSGCDVTTGTAINATGGATITGIDFALNTNGGRIAGTVSSADTSSGIPFASVAIYNSTGVFVSYSTADGSGNYISFNGLTPGTYFATGWSSGFATQLYNGINCASGCDVTTGTAITVTASTTTTGIDFQLGTAFARISGTVQDASSNPISGATVQFYDDGGMPVGSATTNASGNYLVSLSSTGTYYAIASATGFTSVLYDGITCNGCDPITGNPISAEVGATTTNINFILQATGCNGTVQPPTLPNGQVGSPYSATVSSTGMTAPVTFAVTSGDLPDGLTLNGSTGEISGIPTAAGTFIFVITATDASSCTAGRQYEVEISQVNTPTTTVLTASPNPSTYGQAVTLTATVTPEGATGSVVFTEGTTVLGTDDLDANGVASIVVTNFNAGTHVVTATYGGAATYQPSSDTENVVVNKATPVITWPTPADIVYCTALSSTQLNATANVPGTFVYTPAAGTVLNAGTHTLSVAFTPDDTTNYNNASASVSINVQKATPVFSNLSSPTIVIGTASTTISGTISSGSCSTPTGTVSITLNAVVQSAAIQADGSFSSTFATAALVPPSYTISFSYAGDSNYNSATASSTLRVIYATTATVLSTSNANSGATVVFRIFVYNAQGVNISSPTLEVMAYGYRLSSSPTWLPATPTGNNGMDFDFQNAGGGSYKFTLRTDSALAPGTYVLGYTIGADTTIHEVTFNIQ